MESVLNNRFHRRLFFFLGVLKRNMTPPLFLVGTGIAHNEQGKGF